MHEADDFCASGQLMTLERKPRLKQFASWYLSQFVVQCAGGAPVAWTGPLALEAEPADLRLQSPGRPRS